MLFFFSPETISDVRDGLLKKGPSKTINIAANLWRRKKKKIRRKRLDARAQLSAENENE